ncbi:thioredoxin family protein [Rhizobium hidalgonense]|uniref:thioredoxin family protein n=1 Tax=Rhizobium hidalgonense TaxID=1538159 RepID=UPI0013E2A6C2|nr:thioredoxin domain-containing protein [Rhizobium hidalgonense]
MLATEVNKDNFQSEVLECDKPVLVNFWGDGCIPCDEIAPVLEELADKFQGKGKFVKLNVCENPKLAAQFGSMWLLPTLAIFNRGGRRSTALRKGVRHHEGRCSGAGIIGVTSVGSNTGRKYQWLLCVK